ncbi:MAG: DUF1501 domain-containing protein [Bradymonadia bacterium]
MNNKRFDRRDFLKLAGACGLAVATPFGSLSAQGMGEEENKGPFWLFVHAGGGWDPTSLCDPKGRASEEEEDPMNMYFTDDIGEAGNIKYAPVGFNAEFFQKHYTRTMVLNGVDTQTNNHDAGVRHTWSGKLNEGYPSLAALIAAPDAERRPMAFISNGGYDNTGGLVAPTRTGNIGALNRIAYPNSTNGDPNNTFHDPSIMGRILAAQNRRRGHLERTFNLGRPQHGINALFTARVSQSEVKRLSEYLPAEFDRASLNRQAQVAMAAFRAGVARSANLTIGGFDTHGNHDASHIPRLAELLQGVDFAWAEAERQGIADELIVVVGSDFGRTPGYNDGNGKDHWSITSMLLMGAGIPGNMVIGETDARHRPMEVDPATLQVVESGGVRIQPGAVHLALRRLAGIAETGPSRAQFPLIGAETLDLFGA